MNFLVLAMTPTRKPIMWGWFETLDEAITEASRMNIEVGHVNRYFVVPWKEYDEVWREPIMGRTTF